MMRRSPRKHIGHLLRIISTSPDGISLPALAHRTGSHESTVKRHIAFMRTEFMAPIASTRAGYFWKPKMGREKQAEALLITFCGGGQ